MAKNMSNKGDEQGDMNPVVESYQKPVIEFSQAGFSRTTDYIERQNSHQHKAAKDIEKQSYKGRYS